MNSESKTIVKGKNIKHKYTVDKGYHVEDGKRVWYAKPKLKDEEKVVGYTDICEYSSEAKHNDPGHQYFRFLDSIYISDNEKVVIENTDFHAEKNAFYQYVDKVCNEDLNIGEQAEATEIYDASLKKFNKDMISRDHKLKSYCDLNGLNIETVDFDKLYEVVYGTKYSIVDGNVVGKNIGTIYIDGDKLTCSTISTPDTIINIPGNNKPVKICYE